MLKLPEPTLTFKGEYCRDFLKKHDNNLEILPEFLENPTTILEDITRLQVNRSRTHFGNCLVIYQSTGQENTAIISV
jgi:hypothetical protein